MISYFLGWTNTITEGLPYDLLIILIILINIAILNLIIRKIQKTKYNYYKGIQDRETELELLKQQNELLSQLVNNKGE